MERFESLCRSLGTGQYKLSVEVAIMARILARIAQVPDSEIRAIQTDCAQEVKRLGRAPTFLQSPRRERDGLMADDSALLPGRRPGGRRSHVKANDNFLLRLAPNRKTSCQYGRCSTQTTFAAVSLLRSIYSRILRSSSVNLK